MTIKILRALLLFLSQQTFVAERGRTSDWSVIVDIVTPTPGQTWEPIVRLNLNVRIENDGDAAEQVRGAPFRFQICVSGAPGRVTCQPLISNNGELLDVAVEPPGEFGFSTLSAWVRHAGAPINEFVGRADHVLLWSSARSAVTGLEAKLERKTNSSLDERDTQTDWNESSPLINVSEANLLQHLALAHLQLAEKALKWGHESDPRLFDERVWESVHNEAARRFRLEGCMGDTDSGTKTEARAPLEESSDDKYSRTIPSVSSTSSHSSSKIAETDDATFSPSLMARVALVAISNAGYTRYTLNSIASLQVNCGIVCWQKVVCLDRECASRLLAQESVAACHDGGNDSSHDGTIFVINDRNEVVRATASLLLSLNIENESDLSQFSPYKAGAFNDITRYKYVAIHHFLSLKSRSESASPSTFCYDHVVFADGDVVFLRPGFLPHLLNIISRQNLDVATQCDLMGPVVGDDQACVVFSKEHGRWLDYLCSGFMIVYGNDRTRSLLAPDKVLNDPRYLPTLHDQEYFNMVLKDQFTYATLSMMLFPNGSPFNPELGPAHVHYPPPPNPHIIHFNYFPGTTKIGAMKKLGYWYGE